MNSYKQNIFPARGRYGIIRWMLLFSPMLVAVLIMLPRLVSPQFGLFDDGIMLRSAQEMAQGDWNVSWDTNAGRSRLVYRLFYAAQFALFGHNPTGYFIVNTLIFMLTVAGGIVLVRLLKGSRFQAWTAGILFALAGPVIENYYTLSKGEGIQLLWLVLSLILIVLFPNVKKLVWKVLLLAGCSIFLICAILSKETSLVVLPISLGWLAVALFRRKLRQPVPYLSTYWGYVGANLVAVIGLLVARLLLGLHSLTGSGYGSGYIFTLSGIFSSTIRWGGWLIRDFSFLIPLVLLAVIQDFQDRKFHGGEVHINAAIWATGWIAIYLPWMYPAEYYILPAALGFIFIASFLLGQNLDFIRRPGKALLSATCLSLSCLLLLISLANNLSNARIQLAVDAANARSMDYIAQNAPSGSTVLVNIQLPNEYTDEVALHLNEIRHRPDLKVETFTFQTPGLLSEDTFLLVPESHNQPLLIVRMGIIEATQDQWNRSLESYLVPDSGWVNEVQFINQVHLSMVQLPRLLCPLIKTRAFCTTPSPLIDLRTFSYGWTIYHLDMTP